MKTKRAILCVDDEKIVLDSLQEQLEARFGDKYAYEIAESVDEAWEVIDGLTEDGYELTLVVTDWLMPKIKGDEFLIDVHARYPQTIKIMLTGQADPEAIKNAFDNAALYAYLKKPWKADEILTKITRAFNEIGI